MNLLTGTTLVATTTTDTNGQFVFPNVAPGTYTVEVVGGGTVVGTSDPVTVGADDQAIVGIATNGGGSTVNVTAKSTDVFNNDAQLGHAINIANASTTCDFDQVTSLRASGHGWGQIAHECQVPPGVIGLGRSNLSDDDLDNAREQHGHARTHGPSHAGGNGKGKGKS